MNESTTINAQQIDFRLTILSLVFLIILVFVAESRTFGNPISELAQLLEDSCTSSANVMAVFRRDYKKEDIQVECKNEARKLIAALSDSGTCFWKSVSDSGIGNQECVQKVRDGMNVPADRVAILWTGKKAQLTALTASREGDKAKYISLEATQWGAILDHANPFTTWDHRSKHWAVLSSVFTEKSKLSTVDAPIVAGISFPRKGAFVYAEIPRILGTSRDEYIVVDLYGEKTCETEKASRKKDYCEREQLDAKKQTDCKVEADMVSCVQTCTEFVIDAWIALKDKISNFECEANAVDPAPELYDRTVFYCLDRATSVQSPDKVDTNIDGTITFPSAYLDSLLLAKKQLVWTCMEIK